MRQNEANMITLNLPVKILELDHYTLITHNAKESSDFHVNVLGFIYIKKQLVNTGTAPSNSFDMENHILQIPGSTGKTCVITQGLTENSIFSKYLTKYGAGIHHVAYATNNIENTLKLLRQNNIKTTSEKLQIDPVSGMKQIFICKQYAGYFIELIERSETTKNSTYSNDNMKDLALTMESYL